MRLPGIRMSEGPRRQSRRLMTLNLYQPPSPLPSPGGRGRIIVSRSAKVAWVATSGFSTSSIRSSSPLPLRATTPAIQRSTTEVLSKSPVASSSKIAATSSLSLRERAGVRGELNYGVPSRHIL